MGFTIAVVQKQACGGRAMLIAHLARHWAKINQSVGLIDLDNKEHLSKWANANLTTKIFHLRHDAWRLKSSIRRSAARNDITLIDCPTHPGHLFRSVCRESDLILSPCRPNNLDTRSIGSILKIAREERIPSRVILKGVTNRNFNLDKTLIALRSHRAKLLKSKLGNRITFCSGFYHGKVTPSKSASQPAWDEVDLLRQELDELLPTLASV